MTTTIFHLQESDIFRFDDIIYTVKRKWIDDRRPMIASSDYLGEELFCFKGLMVEKIEKND